MPSLIFHYRGRIWEQGGDNICMKKLLSLLFVCFLAYSAYASPIQKTLKIGESFSITYSGLGDITPLITGNAIVAEYTSFGNSTTVRIYAVAPGYGSYTANTTQKSYIIHVVDVTSIQIPENISLPLGGSYTYSPIITDTEATTTLTWTSSNTSVATVNNGVISAVGIGQSVITCTASNGVSAISVITINPILANRVTLSEHECQLNVGESIKTVFTVYPANVTYNGVKWLSTNENIAQVDDTGNITAIAPGYCSIFCIADDGSRKYDKCLIHVLGTTASRADVNGDGHVSVTDAFSVIDVILNNP